MIEKKRLFVAIKLTPSDFYQQIYNELKHKLRFDMISWIAPEMAHVTLKFFGETPVSRIDSISKCIAQSIKNQEEFEVSIDKIGAFGSHHSPKVIWLGMESDLQIRKLHEQLMGAIRNIGYHPDPGNFVPHITLGRVKKVDDKDWFWGSVALFQNRIIQTAVVDKIILYESILLKKGAKHIVIREFPFKVC
jgi:2'-5' RNA ligase